MANNKKATLYGPGGQKKVVDVGSTEASRLQSQGWRLTRDAYRNRNKKNKKRNILSKALKGWGDVSGTLLAYPSLTSQRSRAYGAGVKGASIYKKRVPDDLPQKVKKQAYKVIDNMAQKGNYSGIRKYIESLKD